MVSQPTVVCHPEQTMKQKLAEGITRLLRRLLRIELLFTVCPAVLFPSVAMILMLISPAAGFGVLVLFVIYLSPATAIVNSLGYKTMEGAPPLPLPASSFTALILILAAQAVLVAAIFLAWRITTTSIRWVRRMGSGV
jgi:hypothetical protein